jgi:threonine aldolase
MIDLRTDSVTKPSVSTRNAAAKANVGHDGYGEDPSVVELEESTADVLGMEMALFLPSGTMGNHLAARIFRTHGEEVLVDSESYIFRNEAGGLAQISSLQPYPIDGGERGTPSADQLHTYFNDIDQGSGQPTPAFLALENTHNNRGGLSIKPTRIDNTACVAKDYDLPVFLDGTRLFNAAVSHDCSPDRSTTNTDIVLVSASKGPGAPIGALLAGR